MRKIILFFAFLAVLCTFCACTQVQTEPEAVTSTITTTSTNPSKPTPATSQPLSSTPASSSSAPDHSHSFVESVKEPSCSAEGAKIYTCNCGESYQIPIEKTEHTYSANVAVPTCIQDGYTTYTCQCGDSYTGDHITATGHQFGQWITTKKPTTTTTGFAERICSVCNHKETMELPKEVAGHTHSYTPAVTRPATCSSTGVLTYTCACGASYTDSIAKTSHTYTATVTAPTCTVGGYTTYSCNCGHSYIGNKTSSLGHQITSSHLAASCTADGYYLDECKNCNYSFTITLPKYGHCYITTVYAPTCVDAGYTSHYCTNCGNTYNDAQTPALGHNYQIVSLANATCTSMGVQNEECSHCHDKQRTTLPATGHQHTRNEETTPFCSVYPQTMHYNRTVCTDCNTVIQETPNLSSDHGNRKTMRLSDACTALCNQGIPIYIYTDDSIQVGSNLFFAYAQYYEYYTKHDDWIVDVCEDCGWIFEDTIRMAYTQLEAAQIMCNYINKFRAEVFGTHAYDLVVHEYLVEACDSLMNTGNWPSNGLNGLTIIDEQVLHHYSEILQNQFNGWKENAYMYNLILDKNCKYFGFAYYEADSPTLRYATGSLITRVMFATDK